MGDSRMFSLGLDTRHPLPTSISSMPRRISRRRASREDDENETRGKTARCCGGNLDDGIWRCRPKLSDRTITIIVPFAAGGPTDTVTRLIAEAMATDLGQPVVVETVGGAGGTLGAARVAHAGRTATPCCCTTSAWRRRHPLPAAPLRRGERASNTSASSPRCR